MNLVLRASITCLSLIGKKWIGRKRIRGINPRIAMGRGSSLSLEKSGEIAFSGQFVSRQNVDISVTETGKLELGDKVFMNSNCVVSVHEKVTIGDRVQFGPGCMIFDNDHDYRKQPEERATSFLTSPVAIGKNTWIGAGTILLRGTAIGENCVIGAGCVIKGTIPANSVVIQKRESSVAQKEGKA